MDTDELKQSANGWLNDGHADWCGELQPTFVFMPGSHENPRGIVIVVEVAGKYLAMTYYIWIRDHAQDAVTCDSLEAAKAVAITLGALEK